LNPHEKGAKIFKVKKSYDYVNRKISKYQLSMTAVIANRDIIDGIEVRIQTPDYQKTERGGKSSYSAAQSAFWRNSPESKGKNSSNVS